MSLPTADDARAALCDALAQYAARHPERRDCADAVRHFVRSTPDCFLRRHAAGHITASALLLNPAGNKALLTLHRKLGRWLQLGGHADGEPCPLRTALREAEEESGIIGCCPLSRDIFDVDIHDIPARPGEPAHKHYDIRYLLQAPHEDFRKNATESLALAWWDIDTLCRRSELFDEAVRRLACLWRARSDAS